MKAFFPTFTVMGVVAAATLGACGVDPLVWGNLTSSEFDQPPPAGSQFVEGFSTPLGGGAQVAFFTPGGIALGVTATTESDGFFTAAFPATTALTNTVVAASAGAKTYWGVVPNVPAKKTVYEPSLVVAMGTDVAKVEGETGERVPYMDNLTVDSTIATLIMLAKSAYAEPPSTLGSLSPEALIDALSELETLLGDEDARFVPLRDMVTRLVDGDLTTKAALRAFPPAGQSYLDITALKAGADYTGDGQADVTTAAFDAALRNAANALEFNVCYADDTIKVVLMVDFREGGKDRNCSTINRWKWTQDAVGKQMFITGSLHETTPNCDTDPAPCVESAVFDAASQKLGNWTPNTIPMYDDGTQGDAVAGDNIWTISFDLPYFNAGAPTNRWVRISYKFTWGTPGALWTGSEEWPGNQRILELRDINGDRMIVRQDLYGDETTNKDKSNLLAPAKGGCGSVLWQSELNPPPEGRRENCVDDTLEAQIDTDGDCVLDSWPSQFSASPITIPCDEE